MQLRRSRSVVVARCHAQVEGAHESVEAIPSGPLDQEGDVCANARVRE
jgi:hypothetical protein